MILSTDQIALMSREEKLQTMEAIWADLSRIDANVESPAWHQEALKETKKRFEAGQEPPMDWDQAKRALRLPGDKGAGMRSSTS